MTRYAVLSDIHANYTALQAVVQDASRDELSFWVLGDIVGYGPAREATECLGWLRYRSQVEDRWIPGNHDEWIVSGGDGFGKDAMTSLCSQRIWFERPECQPDWKWFEGEVRKALQLVKDPASNLVVGETRSLVVEYFPPEGRPELALVFTHAAVDSGNRRRSYLYPWNRDVLGWELRRAAELAPADRVCLVYGHTHLPAFGSRRPDGSLCFHSIKYGQPLPIGPGEWVVCPGGVGQPRDGDPRAAYLVLDTEAATVEFRRVAYDQAKVIGKLRDEGRDRKHQERLIDCLREHVSLPFKDGSGRLYHTFPELIEAAYRDLINRLSMEGEAQQPEYNDLYRRPKFDLESYDDWQANHREWK